MLRFWVLLSHWFFAFFWFQNCLRFFSNSKLGFEWNSHVPISIVLQMNRFQIIPGGSVMVKCDLPGHLETVEVPQVEGRGWPRHSGGTVQYSTVQYSTVQYLDTAGVERGESSAMSQYSSLMSGVDCLLPGQQFSSSHQTCKLCLTRFGMENTILGYKRLLLIEKTPYCGKILWISIQMSGDFN